MNNASKGRCVTITPQGKSSESSQFTYRRQMLCTFFILLFKTAVIVGSTRAAIAKLTSSVKTDTFGLKKFTAFAGLCYTGNSKNDENYEEFF